MKQIKAEDIETDIIQTMVTEGSTLFKDGMPTEAGLDDLLCTLYELYEIESKNTEDDESDQRAKLINWLYAVAQKEIKKKTCLRLNDKDVVEKIF